MSKLERSGDSDSVPYNDTVNGNGLQHNGRVNGDPESDEEPEPTFLTRSLNLKDKILYGMPTCANHLEAKFRHLWLDLYYLTAFDAPLTGLAIFDTVFNAALAIISPVFGWYSDTLKSRWGRRRPLMALLTPISALAFFGLLWVPTKWAIGVLMWYIAMRILQKTMTFLEISYRAFGVQLSVKSAERVDVYAWASVFGGIGLLLGTAVPSYLKTSLDFRIFGGTVAAIIFVTYMLLVLFVAERNDHGANSDGQDIVPTLIQACSNYPYFLTILAQIKNSAGLKEVFVYKWIFRLDSTQIFVSFIVTYSVAFASSLVWSRAASRLENKYGATIGYLCTVCSTLITVLPLPADDETLLFGLAILHSCIEGVGVGARNVFLDAMSADCIEYDQLIHGNRREAQFKTTEDIFLEIYDMGYGFSLALLATVGFNAKAAVQSNETMWMMRGLEGNKILAHVIGALALLAFPITRKVHKDIIRNTLLKKKGEAATDPITNKRIAIPDPRIPPQAFRAFEHFLRIELLLAKQTRPAALPVLVCAQMLVVVVATGLCGFGSYQAWIHKDEKTWLFQILVTLGVLCIGAFLFNCLRTKAAVEIMKKKEWHQFCDAYLASNQQLQSDEKNGLYPEGEKQPLISNKISAPVANPSSDEDRI